MYYKNHPFNKLENKNKSLKPNFEKGIQVIYRPIKKLEYFWKYDIGHVFIRFYDKQKGIDKIIESTSYADDAIRNTDNVIEFKEFTQEDRLYSYPKRGII